MRQTDPQMICRMDWDLWVPFILEWLVYKADYDNMFVLSAMISISIMITKSTYLCVIKQ